MIRTHTKTKYRMTEHRTVGRSLVIFLFGLEAHFRGLSRAQSSVDLSLSLSPKRWLRLVLTTTNRFQILFYSSVRALGEKMFYSNVVVRILSHGQSLPDSQNRMHLGQENWERSA